MILQKINQFPSSFPVPVPIPIRMLPTATHLQQTILIHFTRVVFTCKRERERERECKFRPEFRCRIARIPILKHITIIHFLPPFRGIFRSTSILGYDIWKSKGQGKEQEGKGKGKGKESKSKEGKGQGKGQGQAKAKAKGQGRAKNPFFYPSSPLLSFPSFPSYSISDM